MTTLAAVSIAVCWCAFVATWLAAENYNEGRAPAERTRSWFGTADPMTSVLYARFLVARSR